MGKLKRLISLFVNINYIAGYIAGALIFAICCLAFFEVISRGVFSSPTRWSLGISQFLFIYSIFLGSAYCFLKDGHIRIEILIDALSEGKRKALLILGYMLTSVFLFVLIWKGFEAFANAYRHGWQTVTAVQVPTFTVNGIIPIGSVIMLLAIIVKCVEVYKNTSERENNNV